MTAGERLKYLRGEQTRKDVAKSLGVSKSAYAMYESDKRRPRDEIKMRIAEYYGVTVASIFFAD